MLLRLTGRSGKIRLGNNGIELFVWTSLLDRSRFSMFDSRQFRLCLISTPSLTMPDRLVDEILVLARSYQKTLLIMNCFLSYRLFEFYGSSYMARLALTFAVCSHLGETCLQGHSNRTACRVNHPKFGATMQQSRHHSIEYVLEHSTYLARLHFGLEASRNMVTQARLRTLTTLSTSFVMTASRADPLFF